MFEIAGGIMLGVAGTAIMFLGAVFIFAVIDAISNRDK